MNNLNSSKKQKTSGLKVKTNVNAGGLSINHNQTLGSGLKVKTNVKAGALSANHNQTATRGLKIKSGVKAGKASPFLFLA